MDGITASHRLADLGELARQRPQTEEATWRLLGALSFLSPDYDIPASVFQPYSLSSTSEVATTSQRGTTSTTSAAAASTSDNNTTTKKNVSGVKARARRVLNYQKMLQDPLPWVVMTTTASADDNMMDLDADDTSSSPQKHDRDTVTIGNNTRPRSGSLAAQNLFEEALQPLLETGIVRRAHVRGAIIHIDPDTQTLYRRRTIKRHGQRDFDLAVRMMLRAMPPPPSSPIPPSTSSSPQTSTPQTELMHHVLALASHYERYAGWSGGDDEDRSAETKNKNIDAATTKKAPMFARSPRFASTRELEQLTKHTLELAGYQEYDGQATSR
ncbi:hypothetical protein PG991_013086 [Apiospora marii]|uniref:Uncharacterized protein n=1 Tax=Apiospora marii TaxID=335849 RepID=A0ABR1R513_9PEZI